MDNLTKSAIIVAKKFNINPEEDFNRRKLKPKKIDSNASKFYRVVFK